MLPLPWSVAAEKSASTPSGAVPSSGVQLVDVPCFTTTMRFSPPPLAQLTVIWVVETSVNSNAVAWLAGSFATIVCAPPAAVSPDLLASVKVSPPVVIALTLIAWP